MKKQKQTSPLMTLCKIKSKYNQTNQYFTLFISISIDPIIRLEPICNKADEIQIQFKICNLTLLPQFQTINILNFSIMDSRIYFHQYRRPRHANPTYLSSNVQNSMTFFHGGHNPDFNSQRQAPPRYNFEPQYRQKQVNTPIKSYRASQEKVSNTQLPEINPPRSNNSNLSNYGQRSLNLDQKGVYHKQTSPYNIISLKPKEFSDDIRQYPWYSIENRDDVYYKKMQQAYNQKDYYGNRARTFEKPALKQIAGKHTYDLQPKMSINPERKPNNQRFTAKMLNHMDELQHSLA